MNLLCAYLLLVLLVVNCLFRSILCLWLYPLCISPLLFPCSPSVLQTSEAKVRLWIETLLGQECVGTTHQWLRSGAVLCRLINAVNPGLIEPSTVSESAEPMRQRSNIKQFLDCCGEMGLHEGDRFLIDDLYSNRDMKQVTAGRGSASDGGGGGGGGAQRGRLWAACGQRCVDSENSQTTPSTTSTSSNTPIIGRR